MKNFHENDIFEGKQVSFHSKFVKEALPFGVRTSTGPGIGPGIEPVSPDKLLNLQQKMTVTGEQFTSNLKSILFINSEPRKGSQPPRFRSGAASHPFAELQAPPAQAPRPGNNAMTLVTRPNQNLNAPQRSGPGPQAHQLQAAGQTQPPTPPGSSLAVSAPKESAKGKNRNRGKKRETISIVGLPKPGRK